MSTILLRESVTDAPVKKGNRWRVIVARPGQGSSGNYSAEVFKRDAAKIIAPGSQSFITHDEKRDPEKMIGVYPEAAYWSEEDQAVVAELDVFSHWKAFVEEVGPHCGMSLYAMGEMDADGNVTKFTEDPYNGADLVARPGLKGSGLAEKLYEQAIAAGSEEPSTGAPAQEAQKKEQEMEIKDLAEKVDALTETVKTLVSAQETVAVEAAQVEANEEAVAEKVAQVATNFDAVEAARESLLPSQVKNLLAEARKGGDITDAIATQVALAEEVRNDNEAVLTEGRVLGGATVKSASELGKVFG